MKTINIKNQKGIAATDGIIAVLIIMLFSSIIMVISYNIYLTSAFIKRNSQSTEYIVKIFEESEKLYYDDVTTQSLTAYKESLNISSGYNISIIVEKYEDEETPEQEEDVLKIITIEITYKVANKEKEVKMTKLKTRENVITPNQPGSENLINKPEGKTEYNIVPIKYINASECKVVSKESTSWYNYENGEWATYLIVDNEIDLPRRKRVYKYIKYSEKMKYIFGYLDMHMKLQEAIYYFYIKILINI